MTKHAGKPARAAFRILFWTLVLLLAILATGWLAIFLSKWILANTERLLLSAAVLGGLWAFLAAFTLYFFRDPRPIPPADDQAIVAPGHGKVDLIEETVEESFMGGPCQRISIFLSIFDVHVQRSPVAGRFVFQKYRQGKFMNAARTLSADHNENMLLGFEVANRPGLKVAVRLVAGLIARRIVTWIHEEDAVERGDRIGLIQFGSRVDLYLPLGMLLHVKLGDKVKVGETIVASFP